MAAGCARRRRDASRFLATNCLDEDDGAASEEAAALNVAERASLAAWVAPLRSKYDIVGRLATPKEAAEMEAAAARRAAYDEAMERMNDRLFAEEQVRGGGRGGGAVEEPAETASHET